MSASSRILIIAGIPGFHIDSPNSAVANYLRALRDRLLADGYQVEILPSAAGNPQSLSATGKPAGVAGKVKAAFRKLFPALYYSMVLQRLFSFHEKLFTEAGSHELALVIEFYTIGSTLGLQLKKRSGAKLLLIYDNPVQLQFREMYGSRTLLDGKVRRAEASSLLGAEAILCYAPSVREFIRKSYKTQEMFLTMPCIVWKEIQPAALSSDKELVIGFVGSFLNWHKVPLLLNAFETIAQEDASAKLLLVGYGEEWNKVNEMRERSPFKDRIELTGYVSEQRLEELKKQFSIGVMPGSNWYGSPLKLFEYAQGGIPIIAPSTPVVHDLFEDGRTAVFIDREDELGSLIKNIRTLIADKTMAESLARNALQLMNGPYSKKNQMDNFSILVKKLIDGVKE